MRYATVIAAILLCVIQASSIEKKIRLAVSPFDDSLTQASEKEKAGSAAALQLERSLGGIERFGVRGANAIREYIDELTRAQLGLSDPDLLKGRSAALNVEYLTVGTVSKLGDLYEVDARTVDLNDWHIVFAHGSSGSSVGEASEQIGRQASEVFTAEYLEGRNKDIDENPSLAVHRFDDYNEAASGTGYGGVFAEILTCRLGAYPELTVIEKKYAGALLNEKSLEMAGVTENDGSDKRFLVKGISCRVSGDVRVFKDLICVNTRVYNTSDGRMIFASSRDIASHRALRPLAWEISRIIEEALNKRLGTLELRSLPAGAEVFVDNEPAGKTPALLSLLKGKHSLTLRKNGFESHTEECGIEPKGITRKTIELKRISLEALQRAMNLETAGNWEGAVRAYAEFIERYGDAPEADMAYYRKGHVEMVSLKKHRAAVETFQRLLARYPDAMTRAEAYFGLAQAYRSLGDTAKARETLDFLIKKYGDTMAAEEARKLKW